MTSSIFLCVILCLDGTNGERGKFAQFIDSARNNLKLKGKLGNQRGNPLINIPLQVISWI